MEQKKILWVILSVSLFVLIIFGIALFLYSPSRNSATAQAGGETVLYEIAGTSTNVDPDLWARYPDRVAGLDRDAPTATGNIINLNNVNIVSTDGQSSQTSGIDVSDLTVQAGTDDVSGLPKELAEQIGIETAPEQPEEQPQLSGAKKEEMSAPVQPQVAPAVKAQPKAPVKKKSTQASVSLTVKPKAKMYAKPAASQIQILYWVQTASLASRINAERARDKLAAQHMKVEIFTKETAAGLTHRVRVGPFTNNTEAKYWLNSIKKIKGFENSYIAEEKIKTNN